MINITVSFWRTSGSINLLQADRHLTNVTYDSSGVQKTLEHLWSRNRSFLTDLFDVLWLAGSEEVNVWTPSVCWRQWGKGVWLEKETLVGSSPVPHLISAVISKCCFVLWLLFPDWENNTANKVCGVNWWWRHRDTSVALGWRSAIIHEISAYDFCWRNIKPIFHLVSIKQTGQIFCLTVETLAANRLTELVCLTVPELSKTPILPGFPPVSRLCGS